MRPSMHQLMKLACRWKHDNWLSTHILYPRTQTTLLSSPVLNVYIRVWVCFHVCLCSSQWFIETALCFQVGSGTVAFMSSSASEKVGQVRGQGGCPLTPDLTPSPTHWPLLNRNQSGWCCCTVSTWCRHQRLWPHLLLRSSFCGVLFLDPGHILLF